jgi:acyl-CoA thioesterase FadM
MNNARYLRELDFARVDFYERTLLYKTIVSKGGAVVQGATTIRYRRFIKPFTRFQITSRIVYWDDQSIFMEHRFIGPTDGFIHCIALCRQRMIDCSAEDVMATLLKMNISKQPGTMENRVENGLVPCEMTKLKPEMPLEVRTSNEKG